MGCSFMFAPNTLSLRVQLVDHRDSQDVDDHLPSFLAMQRLGPDVDRGSGLLVRERSVGHRGSPFDRSGEETRSRAVQWDKRSALDFT